MSKRRVRKYDSAFSLRAWGTSDSQNFTSETQTGVNPLWTSSSTSRQILSKQRPTLGSSRKEASGWRNPAPFRSYVCKLTPGGAFEYEAENASGTKVKHRGSSGYNPPSTLTTIFLGTTGTGRFPRVSANLVNRCETEALLKLKGDLVNVAESLATINQTLQTIYGVASKMRAVWNFLNWKAIQRRRLWDSVEKRYREAVAKRYARDANTPRAGTEHGTGPRDGLTSYARRAFFRRWGLPSKRPASNWYRLKDDLWLELQYAWKPLVGDIMSAWSLVKGLPRPTATAVRHLEEDEALPYAPATSGALYKATGFITNGVHVRVDAELTSPGLALMDSFSLVNPFSLGWELLPYSFVVDWLLPLGNVIAQLTVPLACTLDGISTTRFTKTNVDFQWTQFKNYKSGKPIQATVSSLATQRTASFFWPFPMPYIKSPFTSATRAVTALALLGQIK